MGYVQDDEVLGRGCFESHRKSRPNEEYFFKSFIREGNELSVDLIDRADLQTLLELHAEEAKKRGANRSFYGWHSFETGVVRDAGGDVLESRTCTNEWHANVVSQDDAEDHIRQICNAIAAEAIWLPKSA